MLSRNEMLMLREEKALAKQQDSYWPRWLRNAMAQVIASIQECDEKLESLKDHLL